MLEELRKKIDDIDDKIAALYDERMKLVKEVALEKSKTGVNLVDRGREKAIVSRVTKAVSPDIKVFTKLVYDTIFETSRGYQSRYLNATSPTAQAIAEAIEGGALKFPEAATVACQGVEGAYSNLAAEKLFRLADIMYFKNFEGVFNAVEKGLCEYGVLPIENSSVGSVNAVYDLMREHRFYIVRSVKLRVRHSLLALRQTTKDAIREVVSHEQALRQCEGFLKTLKNVKITVVDNTAQAARIVAESGRKDLACLSSPECAALYGLGVVQSDVQDSDTNYTRFICISKKLRIFAPATRISMMVSLPHEPGSLNRTLNKFAVLGLNLTKLESRPLPNSTFEFMFYFDFEGQLENREVQNLIAELEGDSAMFTFLGSYAEVQ